MTCNVGAGGAPSAQAAGTIRSTTQLRYGIVSGRTRRQQVLYDPQLSYGTRLFIEDIGYKWPVF